MSKYLIGFGALLLVVLVFLLFVNRGSENGLETITADHMAVDGESVHVEPSVTNNPSPAIKELSLDQSDAAGSVVDEKTADNSNNMKKNIENALESMRASLENEDPRTPELSQPYQRELPTAEELADPTLYEAYELRQTKKVAAIYSAVGKEIPSVKKRIEDAKLSGERSDEEIQEAEEALSKLEQLQQMLNTDHPELQEELETEFPETIQVTDSEE